MDSLATNLALVSAIKEYPCLYDNNLPAYTKKETTDKAWNEVSNEIGIPAGDCKEKWKNLRWGFIRSLRPNIDGSVKKKYYLHDQMEFVLPFIKLLPKHGNYIVSPHIDSDTDEDNIKLLGNDSLAYEMIQEAPNKNAGNNAPTETAKNIEIHKNGQSSQFFDYDILTEPLKKRTRIHELVTKQERETDSRRMFLLSLLPEVNVLTEKQMRAFRRKIFQLIDEIAEDTPQTLYPSSRFQTEIIKTEISE